MLHSRKYGMPAFAQRHRKYKVVTFLEIVKSFIWESFSLLWQTQAKRLFYVNFAYNFHFMQISQNIAHSICIHATLLATFSFS